VVVVIVEDASGRLGGGSGDIGTSSRGGSGRGSGGSSGGRGGRLGVRVRVGVVRVGVLFVTDTGFTTSGDLDSVDI
jgi:hypothetical protein